jgi:hypothetical protein
MYTRVAELHDARVICSTADAQIPLGENCEHFCSWDFAYEQHEHVASHLSTHGLIGFMCSAERSVPLNSTRNTVQSWENILILRG